MEKKETAKQNLLLSSKVSAALREGKAVTLHDGGNLSLIVTGKNEGKWLYRGRKAGSRTLIDLVCGYAPKTGLSEARKKRDEYRLLLKQGINPNEQRKKELEKEQQERERKEKTFSVVADEYFESRKDMTAKTKQSDMGRVENHIKDKIGSIPIADIRRKEHLKPIIDRLSNRQAYTQAKRVAGLIERIFSFAIDAGYIQGTPADRLSRLVPKQPAGTARHHPARTDKAEAADMFRRLWQYLESNRSGPSMVSAMTFIAYLPVRVSNMIAAEWSHVDLEKKAVDVPPHKEREGIHGSPFPADGECI